MIAVISSDKINLGYWYVLNSNTYWSTYSFVRCLNESTNSEIAAILVTTNTIKLSYF
jgi:hypothetical protein